MTTRKRAERMVDFGLDEALITFDMPKEPTDEEIAEVARMLEEGKTIRAKDEDDLEEKYNPNQPRDRYGRWSSGGGGGFAGAAANPKGKDTMEQFKTPDGKWTPERQKLHDEIVAEHFKGKTPVENPTAYMMGGGTAAGKSSILRSGQVKPPDNRVDIDSDHIKSKLPEYQAMTKAGDRKAASFVHEESSYLAKRIQREASEGGYNTLLDGTGDSSTEKLRKKVEVMRAAGQKVVAHYVTVPTEVAIARARSRGERTGRFVPEAFVKNVHASVSKVVPDAVSQGMFDEFNLWDTSAGGTPVHVASAKGSNLSIKNRGLWDSFVAKGK